jgi:type IV pilus assembly protein PilY1
MSYNYSNTGLVATVTWAQLNSAFPNYYPSSMTTAQKNASVTNAETTATLWNYSLGVPANTSTPITTANVPGAIILYDYAPILYNNGTTTLYASKVLSTPLSSEGAGSRNMTTDSSGNVVSPGAMMYTYSLKITSNGLLSLSYIPQTPTLGVPGGTSGTAVQIASNWPIFGTNGAPPANFTFGFAASTGGGTNVHEITCFMAQPAEDTDTSAAANALQAAQIQEYTSVYSAFYNTHGWWGQLTSTGLTQNATTGVVSVDATSFWDASCNLTGDTSGTTLPGGNCAATGATTDVAQTPTSRVIYTWDATNNKGIPFLWANLNATQQAAMGGSTASGVLDGNGSIRVNYLRGDRTQEVTASNLNAPFRPRISVLGDIINSSPIWVGVPSEPLPSGATWTDNLASTDTFPENGSPTSPVVAYDTFASNQQATRLNMVYVGSNDGMLHGFRAGNYSATTGTTSTNNDGKEVMAFMPNAVLNTIHNTSDQTLDYSNPNYAHAYFVDATADSGDVFFKGAWHTLLVGGLGGGGSSIYALDVTNPQSFAGDTTTASKVVLGEWTPASTGLADLGNTYGTPQIARFHSGQWGFVFGNGANTPAASHNGSIFIGLIGQTTGTVSFVELKLPASAAGTAASPNGIISVNAQDFDNDHVTDFIYAGDLYGNVWRFDVTGGTTSAWTSATPIKLFTTASGQPIYSQLQVTAIPQSGALPRVMVEFGTGSQFETPLQTTMATGQQAVYAIWDGNFGTWNTLESAFYQLDAYPSSVTQPYTVQSSGLQAQTTLSSGTVTNSVTNTAENYRVTSSNTVCWADNSGCSSAPQYGWYYNFPLPTGTTSAAGQVLEQVVANPQFTLGAFNVTSYIAAGVPSCTTPQGPTSWTMAFNPLTGAALTSNFFTDVVPSGVIASGVQSGSTGGSSILQLNGQIYAVSTLLQAPQGSKSVAGQTSIEKVQVPPGTGLRLNWAEIK